MEVKGVPSPFEIEESKASLQRSLSAIPSVSAPAVEDEPVKLSVSPVSNPEVGRLNRNINISHALSQAADSIDGLLGRIGEIVNKASKPGVSGKTREDLEAQADELSKGIRSAVSTLGERVASQSSAVSDEIRNEIEQELGKALDLLFPPERSGLSFEIRLSQKDSILNTITSVARARHRIEELRNVIREGSKKLEESVSQSSDVVTANNGAAEVSPRDIEDASALAKSTSLRIGMNPVAAVQSTKLTRTPAGLLADDSKPE